jgi:invasion protein IalB
MIQTRHLLPMSLLAIAFCLPFAPMATAQRQATTPPAPGGEGQPTMLGQYGDWGAYTGMSGGKKVCFALGKPASSQTNPANRPRDPAYMFVSTRPADSVRNEVSVIIGYPFKPDSEASAEVDTARFAMSTKNDNAWIKNDADESRLIEAMRKGANLIVKGTSGRGTETTDRYSLKGIAQAIDRVNQECR